jgi:hypothetical protein
MQAESNYYAAEFCRQSNNLKETWKILKNLIGRSNGDDRDINSLKINGISTTDPTKIATEFNNYFTDIAHSLAKNIPNSNCTIEQNMIPSKVNFFLELGSQYANGSQWDRHLVLRQKRHPPSRRLLSALQAARGTRIVRHDTLCRCLFPPRNPPGW